MTPPSAVEPCTPPTLDEGGGRFPAVQQDVARYAQLNLVPLASRRPWRRALTVIRLLLRGDELWAALLYRLDVWCRGLHLAPLGWAARRLNGTLFGVCIGPHVRIGGGLYLPHGSVVIDGRVTLGRNVTLSPFVAVGLLNSHKRGFSYVGPVMGDNCWVGTGAKILGEIRLGRNVQVGANAVVMDSVPDNCTVAGAPARVVARYSAEELRYLHRVDDWPVAGT